MLNKLESLLHKEMGRMEFLKAAGLAVVSVFGVGALLRMLEGKVSAETAGAATAPVAANTSVPDISVVGPAGAQRLLRPVIRTIRIIAGRSYAAGMSLRWILPSAIFLKATY